MINDKIESQATAILQLGFAADYGIFLVLIFNLEFLKMSLTIRMVTVVVIEDSQLWRKMRIMMMQVFFPDLREEDDGELW